MDGGERGLNSSTKALRSILEAMTGDVLVPVRQPDQFSELLGEEAHLPTRMRFDNVDMERYDVNTQDAVVFVVTDIQDSTLMSYADAAAYRCARPLEGIRASRAQEERMRGYRARSPVFDPVCKTSGLLVSY